MRAATHNQPAGAVTEARALVVSVIVPSRNRRALLACMLERLARQTIDPALVEVVVTLDGCSDGTAEMLESRPWPFHLRVIEQEQRGTAAARNVAAAQALAPVLVFLDDDIMAAPDLLQRHLEAHRGSEALVAVGRLAPASLDDVPPWWRWLEGQLDKQYQAMLAGRRPIDGLCLYSGNFSVSRDAFLQAGGFDERLAHCEDIELGLRLQRRGARFVLALQARGEHWGYRDYASWREMARRYGRWDAVLAFDAGHPSACRRLAGAYSRRGCLLRRLGPLALRKDRYSELVARLLRLAARTLGTLRLGPLERSVYGAIYDLTYWSEVNEAVGGWKAFSRAIRRAE